VTVLEAQGQRQLGEEIAAGRIDFKFGDTVRLSNLMAILIVFSCVAGFGRSPADA
jgi:hypothetical protein